MNNQGDFFHFGEVLPVGFEEALFGSFRVDF